MKSITLTLGLLLLSTGIAAAQDIPLSQILIEGENWKEKGVGKEFDLGTWFANTKSGFDYHISGGSLLGKGDTRLKLPEKLTKPSGMVLWPDDGTLVIGDAEGKHLWAFRVEKDGSLSSADPYYALRMKPGEKASQVSALTVDDKGRLYACTPLGIQVFDPTGRLSGVIEKPQEGKMTGIAFGGENGDLLLVAYGDKLFSRKMQGKRVKTEKPEPDTVKKDKPKDKE